MPFTVQTQVLPVHCSSHVDKPQQCEHGATFVFAWNVMCFVIIIIIIVLFFPTPFL